MSILGLVTLIVSGQAAVVRAGPLEQFVQVLIHDAQPERIAVRYEQSGGGLILSTDGGKTFGLTCAGAIARDLRLGTAAMDGQGRVRVGSFDGLASDDRSGCGWQFDPSLAGRWIVDIVPHPSRPDVTFAAIGTAAEDGALFRSEGGTAFTPIGTPDTARVTRLRLVERPTGLRIYESAVNGSSRDASGIENPNYVIRYSDDVAETWTSHAFPAMSGTVRLEAVDPTEPNRLLVSVARTNAGTTLYLSHDAGATFAPYLELAVLGGVAITPEGRVYVGDAGDPTGALQTRGLYRAESLAETAELVTDAYPVHCLAYRPRDATLFVCDRYVFGTADRQTGELQPLVKLTALERFVECTGSDVGAQCTAPLLQGYCSISHFPCAPICDRYAVDLSELERSAQTDPSLAACLARREPSWLPADAGAAAEPLPAAAAPPPPPPRAADSTLTRSSWSCSAARGSEPSLGLALLLALAARSLRKRRA